MSAQPPLPVRVSAGHDPIFRAGQTGPVWRVLDGVVRLDRTSGPSSLPVQLALPGDLIGIEALCDLPYQFTAEAFTACELEPVALSALSGAEAAAAREALLRQVLLQQQARSHDMATLRTGTVMQRLAHLLQLLGLPWQGAQAATGAQADAVRQALPTLREVAELVDAKTETVCRALAQLLPPRSRKSGPPKLKPVPVLSRPVLAWSANAGRVSAAA